MTQKILPLLSLLSLAVTGCASTERTHDAAVREAERLRADAAKGRYWAIQQAQKPQPRTDRFEILPLRLPERTENGVIRMPSVELIRIPLTP